LDEIKQLISAYLFWISRLQWLERENIPLLRGESEISSEIENEKAVVQWQGR